MTTEKVDHGILPEVAPAKPGDDTPDLSSFRIEVFNALILDYDSDRQSFKDSRLKFRCIQQGLTLGSEFLKVLSVQKAEIQSAYEVAIREVNAQRKYILRWQSALQQRSAVNRARRRVTLSESPKLSYLRARKTCGKKTCYAEVYRDDMCYTHYMKSIGKDPRGVTAQ